MTTHRDLTTPDLRPCPFCGRAPNTDHLAGIVWRVKCDNILHTVESRSWTSAEDAAAAWNRRPRTFTAAEVAEAMRMLLPEMLTASMCGDPQYAMGRNDVRAEMEGRITHWLRENEG